MTKIRTTKLKVFQTQLGFYETIVAAPSRAAALRAWGVRQNLFANGDAHVTDDASAIAAAVQHPEKPLRRAVGSREPFAVEPTGLPKIPEALAGPKPTKQTRAAKTPLRRPPDRTALNAAEAALDDVDKNWRETEAELQREEEALQEKRSGARSTYTAERKAAKAALEAARERYRKAGGTI